MKMKGFMKTSSLLLLSIPLLWWAIREIPLTDIYSTLLQLSPLGLLGLSLLNVLILLLFTGRWWLVIHALGRRLPFLSLVIYRLAGFGVSYFTPGPQFGGEPLQAHLIHKHHNLTGGFSLASVTIDKLIEILVNFTFLMFGMILIFRAQQFSISQLLLLIPAGLLAFPLVYFGLLRFGRRPVTWFLKKLTFPNRWQPAYKQTRYHIVSAEEQVATFVSNRPRFLLGTLGLSCITWGIMILEYWLTLNLLGIQLEPMQVIIALTAARVAFLLPVPAGLGALEAGQVTAMHILGFEPVVGISVSLLIRARDLALGGLGLWLGGLSTRHNPSKPISGVQTVPIQVERRDEA
jgi:glycosyltransferase 2 family protein